MKLLRFICLLFSFCFYNQAFCQSPFQLELALFYHFKSGVVTFTFDDATSTQFSIGAEYLNLNNFKGTFFISINFIGEEVWIPLNELVKKGHEIGSHTLSHPKLTDITLEEVKTEIEQSKEIIEANIKNYKCFSFAYPHGRFNDDVKKIVSLHYEAARIVDPGLCSDTNNDYFALKTFFFNSKTKLKVANRWVNTAIHNNKWLIESYHSFDGEGYQPISSDLFRKHLAYIKSKEDVLWVATFRDVVKYLKEKQNATVNLIDSTTSSYQFLLNDNLPDSIYDHPLTLKVKVPKSWKEIQVTQSEHIASSQIQTDPLGNQFVVFDAVPDRGVIKISSQIPYNADLEKCENCDVVIYPVPFTNSIRVLWNPDYKGNFLLVDLNGKTIMNGELQSGIQQINTEFLKKGPYLVHIDLFTEKGEIHLIKKIVKE